jgi:hypothetical protein
MKTHFDNVHFHLVAKRKIILIKGQWLSFLEDIILDSKGKKRSIPLVMQSLFFLGQQTFTSLVMKHIKNLWKTLWFSSTKDTSFVQHVNVFGFIG